MDRHARTGHKHLSYALSRFFRIAPLFYLLVAVTYIADAAMFGMRHGLTEVGLSVTFLFNLVPGYEIGIARASWTVGVEMLFYIVFPTLLALQTTWARRIGILAAAIGLGVAFPHVTAHLVSAPLQVSFQEFSVFRHLPTFLLGMIAYNLYRDGMRFGPLFVGIGFVGLVLLAVVVGNSQQQSPIAGLLYALILVGMATERVAAIDNAAFRFLGKISYSIYLWHIPIIIFLTPVYRHIADSYAGYIALTFSVLLPVSYCSYRLVELPSVWLGKWVFNWRTGGAPKITSDLLAHDCQSAEPRPASGRNSQSFLD